VLLFSIGVELSPYVLFLKKTNRQNKVLLCCNTVPEEQAASKFKIS